MLTHIAVPPCYNDILIQRIERTLICLFESTGLVLYIPLYLYSHITLTIPPYYIPKRVETVYIEFYVGCNTT